MTAPVTSIFPAMIDAAQAAILVAAEHHRRAAVRRRHWRSGRRAPGYRGTRPDPRRAASRASAGRLAPDPSRTERNPVQPEQRSHRRSGADPNQCFIVLVRKHVCSLGALISAVSRNSLPVQARSSRRIDQSARSVPAKRRPVWRPRRDRNRAAVGAGPGGAAVGDHPHDHLDPPPFELIKRVFNDGRFRRAFRQFRIGDAPDPDRRRRLRSSPLPGDKARSDSRSGATFSSRRYVTYT